MLLSHCDWQRGWSLAINILQVQTVFSLTRALHQAAQTCQSVGAVELAALLSGLSPKQVPKGPLEPDRMAFIFWDTC